MATDIEIDGIDTDVEDDIDSLATQFLSTENDQIGAVGTYVDPETFAAWRLYLRDWRERMATFRAIERQQMGRPSRAFPGERAL